MRPVDISGERYGKLVAVESVGSNIFGKREWRFSCDCGGETVTAAANVRRGHTVSCGCVKAESARRCGALSSGPNPKHSLVGTPEYNIWKTMRQRCFNPNSKDWGLYGGRGIKICERWNDFRSFIADMGKRPSSRHSIDRWPDNDGNYEPKNCRWATDKEQANNRRKRKD